MSPRTSRSFAALIALVAACVLSPAARSQAAGGTACWAMTPEERQKGSPSADIFTWYHNALESLKRSDPESVKKAIFNLRWCIVSKASSGGFVIAGNRVDRLEYYPYAHLGLAYSKLGNYPCAKAAFAYELEKQGKPCYRSGVAGS